VKVASASVRFLFDSLLTAANYKSSKSSQQRQFDKKIKLKSINLTAYTKYELDMNSAVQ